MEEKGNINRNITILFWVINLLFIGVAFMYEFTHSAGGAGLEVMAMGFTYIYIIDIVFIITIAIFRRNWFYKNRWFSIYFVAISIFFGPIAYNTIDVYFSNRSYRQKMVAEIKYYQPVAYTVYKRDSASLKSFFSNDSVVLDTLIYSPSKNKIIGFIGRLVDTSELSPKYAKGYGFWNREIFIEKGNDKLYIHYPTGGNYISQDSTIEALRKQLVRWYYVNYSFDESGERPIWTDKYLWSKNVDTIEIK